ncbi:Protein of unknown function [Gryllus bimaculatus]|nr:Protein of unknown function [Gryllus bimaculatus]
MTRTEQTLAFMRVLGFGR